MPSLEYPEGLGSHALTTIRTMRSREVPSRHELAYIASARLWQGAKINLSLFNLGVVVSALAGGTKGARWKSLGASAL